MKILHILAALVVSGAFVQPALAQARVLELGHEASVSMVRLPTNSSGELTLQTCATCKLLRLRASESTRYVIGGELVSLAELTKYLERHPTAMLVVMQLKDSLDLARIVVPGGTRAQ